MLNLKKFTEECIKLKKNRSNNWTTGLSISVDNLTTRFFFFDIDKPYSSEVFNKIVDVYRNYQLDLLVHRTGNGWHFISPTLVNKMVWQIMHKQLKDINSACPHTTLRVVPNKYPDEKNIWFNSSVGYFDSNEDCNSLELSNLLNKWFGARFKGLISTELKFVKYPLPIQQSLMVK